MVEPQARFVSANDTEIHYRVAGDGRPLIVLHGGSASNDPAWDPMRWGFGAYIAELAEDFHVFAPDIRGHGATVNLAGTLSYDLLAEDLVAFVRALELERPALIGFSEGGIIGAVVTISEPDVLGPHVNIAGYDLFDPASPAMEALRRTLSHNDPNATEPDLDYIEQRGGPWFEALVASHDAAQGPGTWRRLLVDAFEHWTAPIGYSLDDLRRISTPTLIMAGDRDPFCGPAVSADAFARIPGAELAVIPNCGHIIAPEMLRTATRFIASHGGA